MNPSLKIESIIVGVVPSISGANKKSKATGYDTLDEFGRKHSYSLNRYG